MRRAFELLLVSLLGAASAAARGSGGLAAAWTSEHCDPIASSDPALVEEVAGKLEELLRGRHGDRERWMDRVSAALALLPASIPTEVESAVGDVFLLSGRLAPAMEAYRRAAEAWPEHPARCGVAYDGRVYTFEIGRTTLHHKSDSSVAPVLLVRDPVTGHVLERFLLPSRGAAFRVEGGILHVFFRDDDLQPTRFVAGRPDYPVWAPDLLARFHSRKGSLDLGRNFLFRDVAFYDWTDRMSPEFTLRADAVEGPPSRLEDLETELRQAIVQDPTQPWNLFLLGQSLHAQGRGSEAAAVWEELFTGAFPATPYYEYTWMARYFELYRQPEWADAALGEALARRRDSPLPVDWSQLVERMINVPTDWRFKQDPWPEIGVERAYVWWTRLRQISGVSQGDNFRAVLWADYFESVGDRERAAAERTYLDRVRQYPWLGQVEAFRDYATWLLFASAAGAGFMVLAVSCKVLGRLFRRVTGRAGIALRWSHAGAVAVPVLVLFLSLAAYSLAIARLRIAIPLQANDDWAVTAVYRKAATTERRRLRTALASHAAGELTEARRTYASLPPSPLVRQNTVALERNLPPVVWEPLPGPPGDASLAFWGNWIRNESWRPWHLAALAERPFGLFAHEEVESREEVFRALVRIPVKAVAWIPGLSTTWKAKVPYGWALLLAGLLPLVRRRWRARLVRIVPTVLPGATFLRRGRLLRAYAAVWTFSFAAFPLLWLVGARLAAPDDSDPFGYVSVGPYTFGERYLLPDEFALPSPELGRLVKESFWSLVGVFPYARLFYLLVALSSAAHLFLQVRVARRHRVE